MRKLIKNLILNIVKEELENLEEELRDDMQELDYKIDDKLDADEYDFDDFVRGESLNDLIRDELGAIENEKG
jgi:hypothetical protein